MVLPLLRLHDVRGERRLFGAMPQCAGSEDFSISHKMSIET